MLLLKYLKNHNYIKSNKMALCNGGDVLYTTLDRKLQIYTNIIISVSETINYQLTINEIKYSKLYYWIISDPLALLEKTCAHGQSIIRQTFFKFLSKHFDCIV